MVHSLQKNKNNNNKKITDLANFKDAGVQAFSQCKTEIFQFAAEMCPNMCTYVCYVLQSQKNVKTSEIEEFVLAT